MPPKTSEDVCALTKRAAPCPAHMPTRLLCTGVKVKVRSDCSHFDPNLPINVAQRGRQAYARICFRKPLKSLISKNKIK